MGCYWLFLRRHTFFSLNRAYLLVSAVLSLALPLVSLPAQTVEPLPQLALPTSVMALPETIVAGSPVDALPADPGMDWAQISLVIYGLIALFLLIRLVVRIGRLLALIRQAPRQAGDGFVLVQSNDSAIATFSFFHFLVLNTADTDNALILRHELVHIRQHHSADVMGMALLRAIFWAFPTLWLTDRLLRQVHEFLADKQPHQPTDYARFLVDYAFGLQTNSLTNGFFNPSLLRLRIQMLHQRNTARWALGKYVLVLPLVFGLLAMTTAREQLTAVVSQATEDTITVSGQVTSAKNGKPLVGATVIVSNTGKGTPTNRQGQYKLEGVPKTATLSVSFEGFALMTVPISNRSTIDVALVSAPPDELPTMGATKAYKAIKPNPAMPIRTPPSSETINGKVYTAVEEPAVFPAGIPGLMQYIAHSLQYPAKAKSAGVQGKVLVQFVVLPSGTIGSATVKKGIGSGCDEEALRVVRQMPRWIPGKQNGKAVATQFVLPIQFSLEKKEDKRTGQYEPIFQPTDTPIGEFPVSQSGHLHNQPQLNVVRINVPASVFKSDTTPNPRFDTSKDGWFWQRNDVNKDRYAMPLPDSLRQPVPSSLRVIDNGAFGPLGTEPLYILNGVELPKGGFNKFGPNDIESITVQKGAPAVATYGSKAQYGVVLITTKKK